MLRCSSELPGMITIIEWKGTHRHLVNDCKLPSVVRDNTRFLLAMLFMEFGYSSVALLPNQVDH
jgi:hypothetical protein